MEQSRQTHKRKILRKALDEMLSSNDNKETSEKVLNMLKPVITKQMRDDIKKDILRGVLKFESKS